MNLKLFRRAVALLFLELAFAQIPAYAHPDLEEQIQRLTSEIQLAPTNAELFIRRADIQRRHEAFDLALADYAEAARISPGSDAVSLGRAQVYQDSGRIQEALVWVNEVLNAKSNQPVALILRARCYQKLNQSAAAIADLSAAIQATPLPQPDLYVERAQAQAGIRDWTNAVAGLDEGIKRLGEIPSLQVPALDYERRGANYDAALHRIEKIMSRQPGNESWRVLKAEVLEQAGRFGEARVNFQQVLSGIDQYSPARRNLELTQQLRTRAADGLSRVSQQLSQNDRNSSKTTQNTKP